VKQLTISKSLNILYCRVSVNNTMKKIVDSNSCTQLEHISLSIYD